MFGGVKNTELTCLLSYIYTGSCNIEKDRVKEFSAFLTDLGVNTSAVKSSGGSFKSFKFKVKEEASPDAPNDELEDIISQCDIYHDDPDSDEEDDGNNDENDSKDESLSQSNSSTSAIVSTNSVRFLIIRQHQLIY